MTCLSSNRPASLFSLRAGRHTRTGINEPYEQTSAAALIIKHESYDTYTMDSDVALIRLQTPFTFNDYVSPSCLADTEPQGNTTVWVAGWGYVEDTCCDGNLKQAKLPIIDRATCQSLMTSASVPIPITAGMLCAGTASGYPSTCNGDSGGAVVVQTDANKFVQVGLVSWSMGGCDSPNPNVYANVARYKPWIVSKISQFEKEQALVSGKYHPRLRLGAAFRAVTELLEH